MIKSLKINCFQSHENSTLDFHPGVNIIIGETDKGKTAIIRALRWLVWNRPSGDAIRSSWGGETSVRLETEEGFVIRSKDKVDQYDLHINGKKTLTFKAFATSVPEEISRFLNISEINLQEQLDNHFLLGKGWTPGSVAAHFNKVANINKIDSSTSNINKKITQLESDIKYDEIQIKEKQTEILQYEYLDKAESLLEVLEDQENRLNKFYSSRNKLQTKIDDVINISNDLEVLNEEIINEDSINILLDHINRKEKQTKVFHKLRMLVEEIKTLQKEIDEISQLSDLSPLVTGILKDMAEKESKNNEQKTLFKTITSIQNIKTQLNNKKENYTTLLETFNREFPDICPLCNTNLKNHKPCL